MSAAVLREAASLMRERAEAATPGPWGPRDAIRAPFQIVAPTANICGIHDGGQTFESCIANAAHIASWHPAVALAVADWLDATADDADGNILHFGPAGKALTVATTYLAHDPP